MVPRGVSPDSAEDLASISQPVISAPPSEHFYLHILHGSHHSCHARLSIQECSQVPPASATDQHELQRHSQTFQYRAQGHFPPTLQDMAIIEKHQC
eukprot:1142775-Pelagomonas_calceolata.AAC.1